MDYRTLLHKLLPASGQPNNAPSALDFEDTRPEARRPTPRRTAS